MSKISMAEAQVTQQITEIETTLTSQVDQLKCARVETDFFSVNDVDRMITADVTEILYGPWCVDKGKTVDFAMQVTLKM